MEEYFSLEKNNFKKLFVYNTAIRGGDAQMAKRITNIAIGKSNNEN